MDICIRICMHDVFSAYIHICLCGNMYCLNTSVDLCYFYISPLCSLIMYRTLYAVCDGGHRPSGVVCVHE